MSVPRAPHPALVTAWVAGACAVGGGLILLDRPPVTHLLFTCYLMVLAAWLAVRVHRRKVLAGVDQSVPVALMLWGLGHLSEVVRLSRGEAFAAPLVPADLLFLVVGVLVTVAATGVLWRSAHHLQLRSLVRSTLDSLLLALAAILVFWRWLASPLLLDPDPTAFALSAAYVGVCTLMATTLVMRAVQRLEIGAWLLAFSGSVPATGIGFWVLAKLGVGSYNTALALFIVGALVLPLALSHPGHRRQVTVREGGHRENLWPVGLHLGAWGVFYLTLGEQPLDRITLTLTTASIVGLFLRIFLVRLSERSLYEQLRTMAFTDSLTGAANRRGLLERLGAMQDGWLVSIDLDGFKQVNDEHGHDVGDGVLLDYVRRSRALLPEGALLARVGGDEFAVLGPGPLAEGVRVAEQLVRAARVLAHQGVTASAGVAEGCPARTAPAPYGTPTSPCSGPNRAARTGWRNSTPR